MGIDADLAAAAAAETGNANIDAALALLFGGASSGGGADGDGAAAAAREDTGEPCKMTIVVNTSLEMSPGKIAAQCCHANLAAYKETIKRQTGYELLWAGGGL